MPHINPHILQKMYPFTRIIFFSEALIYVTCYTYCLTTCTLNMMKCTSETVGSITRWRADCFVPLWSDAERVYHVPLPA